jgi:Lrp/AsnC family transcriptional regulator for asnA, asnC and gidA
MDQIRLDAIDAAIISLLQEDGRMSAAAIARRLDGVSSRVVRYRLDRLFQAGIVSVKAIVNPKSLGYSVMADIMVEADPGKVPEIVDHLVALDEVTYVSTSMGDPSISIAMVARSLERLRELVINEVQLLAGVRRVRTYILPVARKRMFDWKLPREAFEIGE